MPKFTAPTKSGSVDMPPSDNPSQPSGPSAGFHTQRGANVYVPNGYYYDGASNSLKKGSGPRKATIKLPSRAQRQSRCNITAPAAWSGKCVGVADGDTITVMHVKTPLSIRLYGVDCPEKAQPFGQQAKSYTGRLRSAKL